MSSARGQWVEVTRKSPCKICGRSRWCGRSPDGRMLTCRWLGGPGAVERRDTNGVTYWLHPIGGQIRLETEPLPPAPQPERADEPSLDRVYRTLLSRLSLETYHRQNLRQRGLTDSEIQQRGYRSLPQTARYQTVQHLTKQFGLDIVSKVPGFIQRKGARGDHWTLGGSPGLLIPVRNLDCAITGMVVRVDDAGDGGKYRWLSSSYYNGPSAKMQCHLPLYAGDTSVIRVTEGQLKADVATVLSRQLTLGVPGVNAWRLALPILEHLKLDSVLLSFDSDWRQNPHVARSLGDCAKYLNNQGFYVQVEDWDPEQGKGVDDVLLAGHAPRLRNWQSALVAKHRGTARRREVKNG